MKIPVLGCDPSLRSWGMAEAMLDLNTGLLSDIKLLIAKTAKSTNKQLRTNSDDISRCHILASTVIPLAQKAKYVFAEIPVGSQSASGMKSYGVCCGIIGAMQALNVQVIQVNPIEVKQTFVGSPTATKQQMIDKAIELYPEANWPKLKGGSIKLEAEHMADAIAAIHAGVNTPEFKNIVKLFNSIQAGN